MSIRVVRGDACVGPSCPNIPPYLAPGTGAQGPAGPPGSVESLFYLDASDFGMVPGEAANAAALNNAIAAAAVLGSRSRVYIPPGIYAMEATVQHIADVIVFGTGRNTILVFGAAVSPAWNFETTFDRSELSNVQILGSQATPAAVGVDLNATQHVYLHDMEIWDYQVGILLSDGAVFSAYHVIGPNVEVNRCPVSVRAWENANGNLIVSSRLFFSHTATDSGIGLDVRSAQLLEVDDVQIEGHDTCVRVRNTNGLLQFHMHDCYLEPGVNPLTGTPGQAYDVDVENLFDGIEIVKGVNNVVSASRGTVALPPEGLVEWDGYSRAFYGARFDGASVPKRNYVYNGQLLYYGLPTVLPGWGAAGALPTLASSNVFVTGNRSLQATATGVTSTVSVGFVVSDDGVDWVTCGIRYQILAGNVGFGFSGVIGANARQYVPEPLPAGVWREAWVTVPVDPTNRQGAVSFTIDSVNGTGAILIDEAWAVPGKFAQSSTQYGERFSFLPAPVPIFSRVVTVNDAFGPIDILTLPSMLVAPLDAFCTAPTGVVGCVVRMELTVNNSGSGVLPAHHWMYLDVPASGAVVPASYEFMPTVYDQQPVSKDVIVRDTSLSGGYNAATIVTAATYGLSLIAWIIG